MIKFGEWLPDQADLGSGGATEAKNVIPFAGGFRPLPGLNITSSALNLYCRGAFSAKASDGNAYSYAGSGTKLYQLVDATWTDQSKASGTYAVSDEDHWEFEKWGEKVLAIGGINASTPVPPQVITLGAAGATEFADITGSPPQARHIGVVRDFVVMGNLYEGGANYPNRIRWSGVNDETAWGTNPATQADYQDLLGRGGWVQKVVSGEFGVIIQEHSVRRMEYVGPPVIWNIIESLPGIGTPSPSSVVRYGNLVFMLSQTGFQAIESGAQVRDIGANRVNKWFYERVDMEKLYRVVGALDRARRLVYWIYPGPGNVDGRPNEGLIYDIESDRWSRFVDELEWIYEALSEGYTLEGLDNITTNLDALLPSMDSRFWAGGAPLLGAFDEAHKSGSFDGNAMDATLDTLEDGDNSRRLISRVRPEVDGASTITVAPGVRDAQTESVTWGSAASAERDGNHAMRSDGRYHRFRVAITGGFEKAQGVSLVEASRAGDY